MLPSDATPIDYLIGSSVLVDPLADNKLVAGGTFVQK